MKSKGNFLRDCPDSNQCIIVFLKFLCYTNFYISILCERKMDKMMKETRKNRKMRIRDDNFGGMPGILKIAIVAVVVYIVATIAIPKWKDSQVQKDKDNIAKLTTVLQGAYADEKVRGFVPHGKGGIESEYSMKDVMYFGGGNAGDNNALNDFIVEGVGKDFPELLITTKKDIKIKIIGNKNYLEFFLYADDSSKEENMLAHFYSPVKTGDVDPEGMKYQFYDAKDE